MLEMIVKQSEPQPITFNYEELKAELIEVISQYENKVYTENDIATAKKERANLNNLKSVLNNERIRREKDYMQSFNTFKTQVKELCDIIDGASKSIGSQIDAFEKARIKEKETQISTEYDKIVCMMFSEKPKWLSLSRIFDEKWLNKSVSISKINEAIKERLTGICEDIKTLESMGEYEAIECYKKSLNINDAIKESQAVKELQAKAQKAAEAQEAKKEEAYVVEEIPFVEPEKVDKPVEISKWVSFQAYLNNDQAAMLATFCKDNKIKLRPIQ